MLANSVVLRPKNDCLAITATRLPLPPGIFAFESRKVGFVSVKENIRDRIDGFPKARTFVVVVYIGWLVFFKRKNEQQREAKSLSSREQLGNLVRAEPRDQSSEREVGVATA
jgi:hypothetical protein